MSLLLDPGAHPVVAHRGNSAYAPENSMEAFRQGIQLGADAIEFDIHLTRDGQIVVIHDPDVARTTNGTGLVADTPLRDLSRLDAGYRFTPDRGRTFPWRDRGILIPTLEEVLRAFSETPMIIEIKTPAASIECKRLLERHAMEPRVVVGSFSDEALAPFRGSRVAHGASRRDVARLFVRAALPGAPVRLPYQSLFIPPNFRGLRLPVLRFASMARHAGVTTHVWTVDEPRRARRYWDGGVNAIITNDPSVILAAAGRMPCPPIPATAS
jgi:glycerophosphoryl diester phosphodiesterase